MKKIKLDLDDLQVESFATTPGDAREEEGTVFGYITSPPLCPPTEFGTCGEHTCFGTCGGGNTCYASCGGTCNTCSNTCYNTCSGVTCGCQTIGPTCPPGCNTDFACTLPSSCH